jgi:hypothetical protein
MKGAVVPNIPIVSKTLLFMEACTKPRLSKVNPKLERKLKIKKKKKKVW